MRQDGDGNGRNEQSRQQVEGLDLLDAQDAQAGGKDQHAAHQTDFRHQRIGDERSNKARQQVDGTLPAEQDDGRQRNADPECGREHNGRDTVQNRIGKQIGVIPLQRALDGAQDGQSARAVEQDGRGKPLRQIGALGNFGHRPVKQGVQREGRANDAAQRQTDDKQHMVFGVRHGLHDGVDAQRRGSQAHGIHHDVLIFFVKSFAQGAADDAAHQNRAGVGNGSDHGIFSFLPVIFSIIE